MSLEYRIGDVLDHLDEIPDGSIDLIVTSPPFLALRSYLPADHPDKGKEIGSEATPAEFIDTLLALSAEWGRVLAPHGSLCVELGDTFSGSGGGGGDYLPGGLREDQPGFGGSAARAREGNAEHWRQKARNRDAWPLAKSLTGIPTLYPWSLAYGRNLLTGQPSPAGQWRIRNLIVWARPNPPVGALGDKFRPATSYITVACKSAKRYFDLDAVRTENPRVDEDPGGYRTPDSKPTHDAGPRSQNPAGAPPLDWHTDNLDGDWLWRMATQPFSGAHFATFPLTLPKRLIEAMCPLRVCTQCGRPSERITEKTPEYEAFRASRTTDSPQTPHDIGRGERGTPRNGARPDTNAAGYVTLGWSDCVCLCYSCRNGGCPTCAHKWRTGNVLDPFAGSGTTLEAAQAVGRHAIGIDLDDRNAELARARVGMFLETYEAGETPPAPEHVQLTLEEGVA